MNGTYVLDASLRVEGNIAAIGGLSSTQPVTVPVMQLYQDTGTEDEVT